MYANARFLGRMLAGLMAGRVEIEVQIVVLWTVWHARVPIVTLNLESLLLRGGR